MSLESNPLPHQPLQGHPHIQARAEFEAVFRQPHILINALLQKRKIVIVQVIHHRQQVFERLRFEPGFHIGPRMPRRAVLHTKERVVRQVAVIQPEGNDVVMTVLDDAFGPIVTVCDRGMDIKSLAVLQQVHIDAAVTNKLLGGGDGVLIDGVEHFQAQIRVPGHGADRGGGIQPAKPVRAGNRYRQSVFIDVRIDGHVDAGHRVLEQGGCGRRTKGNGHRFGAPQRRGNFHGKDFFDAEHDIPFSFVVPNADRAVSTRCGVGMMEAVPSGDHRAILSVAGAPRGKCRSGEIAFAADSPN